MVRRWVMRMRRMEAHPLRPRISQGANLNEVRQMARDGGMKSLRVDGMEKVKAGITTLEEVYRATT